MANTINILTDGQIVDGLVSNTLVELEDEYVESVAECKLRYLTNLRKLILKNATTIYGMYALDHSNTLVATFPILTKFNSSYTLNAKSGGVIMVVPSLTTGIDDQFRGGGAEVFDIGPNIAKLNARFFYQGSVSSVVAVILRRTESIVAATSVTTFGLMSSTESGNNAPCKNTHFFVPESLIGTYQSATIWSSCRTKLNFTFHAIEGSPFEYYYANGEPIDGERKAVDSITATYTDASNSVNIYQSTSLDTLKYLLVVKGIYNEEEFIIPPEHYELSGNLVVGNSTITVTYMNEEATFNVTVKPYQSSLPNGYTQLSCIIANGNQCSVTDIAEDGFYAEYGISVKNICYRYSAHIFSSANYTYPKIYYGDYATKQIQAKIGSSSSQLNFNWEFNTLYNIEADLEQSGSASINGVDIGTYTVGTTRSDDNKLAFFKSGTTSRDYQTFLFGALFYMRLYKNNELVHEFVPCKNDQNVIGLYDTQDEKFYSSNTSESFIAG